MRQKKFLFYTLGTISLLSTVAIPVWIHFRNKSQEKEVQKQEALEFQKNLKMKETKLKVILNSIQVEDIKLMDNIGLQYKENAQKKQFHLINPNWVTTLHFDKNKLKNSKKKEISYELKPGSLNTIDSEGSVKYTVLLKLENQSREINIHYDNLPSTPKRGILPYQIKKPQKLQYFINKYAQKYEGDLSKLDEALITKNSLSGIHFDKVDVSQVNKWPQDLSSINWKGIKGLNHLNTPFKGDLSEKKISASFFYDVDVSKVTKWPNSLVRIDWTNIKGLDASNTPFKDDLSSLNIDGSTLSGIDLSKVTKWPQAIDVQLENINFDGIIFTLETKPHAWTTKVWDKIFIYNKKTFNGFLNFLNDNDIKDMDNVGLQYLSTNEDGNEWKKIHLINPEWINKNNLKLNKQKLKKPWTKFIDVSVKPSSLITSDTTGTIKYTAIFKLGKLEREFPIIYTKLTFTKGKNPFVHKINDRLQKQYFINEHTRANNGDLSSFHLKDAHMRGIDVSKITKWPNDLSGIQWFGISGFNLKTTPFQGDISNLKIYDSSLVDINLSKVTNWPKDLSRINWNNARGLNEINSPFKGDLREYKIFDSNLINLIFKVTHWPRNLSGIKWYLNALNFENTPFKGDMSSYQIQNSILDYVDVSSITKWPNDISGVNFNHAVVSWKTKPPTWREEVWNIFSANIDDTSNNESRNKRKTFLATINQKTIIQMDNVGLQYATGAQVKKLHLINPSWVTYTNIKLDKRKWNNKLSDFIKISIKPNSLQTSYKEGFIKYTAVVSFDSEKKEIEIEYNNLTIKHFISPIVGSFQIKNTYAYIEHVYTSLWNPIKQIQWYINIWNKLTNGGNQVLNGYSFSNLDFKDIDVSQIKKFPLGLEKTSWEGIIGLSEENTPFKDDISRLQLQGAILSGVNLEKVTKFPQNLEGVNFANSINAKFFREVVSPANSLQNYNLKNVNLKDVDVSNVRNWPNVLKGINFEGVIGINNRDSTPFEGDLRILEKFSKKLIDKPNFDMTYTTLKGIDMSYVAGWPQNLEGINWNGVLGLNSLNTPFKGDLANGYNISGSTLNGVDVSGVTEWPTNLANINWTNVKGLTAAKTPFQGDMSAYNLSGSNFNGVDISKVTKWPKNLHGVNFSGAINKLTEEKKKELKKEFTESVAEAMSFIDPLKTINVKQINTIKTFGWVNFENSELLSHSWTWGLKHRFLYNNMIFAILRGIKFKGIDLKGTEINWPTDLAFIDWSGVKGLTANNTPFKEDISSMKIQGSILKGVDVSQVTKWPDDLRGINWEGVIGLTSTNTPFKGDISQLKIHFIEIPEDAPFWHEDKGTKRNSNFKGINLNQVTKWPKNFDGVIWNPLTPKDKKPNIDNIG